jgi:hypothetical protein
VRPAQSPELRIEAPPELAAVRARFESNDPTRLAGIQQLIGLPDAGAAIPVMLATEDSDWARRVSPWVAGFAVDSPELVVIFPARSPTYPHDTLDDVLRHEVTHVLIARASAHRPIPRWFNEGLAMAAEHGWRFEDQTQLLYQLVLGPRIDLNELDDLFAGGRSSQSRAYALSGAIVQDLLQRHGMAVAREILMRVRNGASFDTAFTDAVGSPPSRAESDFWDRQRIWTTWVPVLTSSAVLWIAVTLLALLAIRRRRQKDAEIVRRWEDEGED